MKLHAGDLSCELEDGAIRYVRWRRLEVLRGIAYLLRDADWGTAPIRMHSCQVREEASAFEVDIRASMGELAVRGSVRGAADGTLDFRMAARCEQPVRTSRCGFVLLHPADVAGNELQITHTDGGEERTRFPLLVSPGQPVFDIRRLRHGAAPGLWVECLLEAELPHDPQGKFEMEDQRNWSDASFKTYVGSLLDSWPYEIPAGREFVQRVRVRVEDERAPVAPKVRVKPRTVALGGALEYAMPAVGVFVPAGLHLASEQEKRAVRELRPQWLHAEVAASDAGVDRDLAELFALARTIDARVQLDMVCDSAMAPALAVQRVRELCDAAGGAPDAVRALPEPLLKSYQPQGRWPEVPSPQQYAAALSQAFPLAAVGGGMFTNFTELNRARPPADGLAFIGHGACPIVHAADDRSVMETLQSLPYIARSVQTHWSGVPYRIGPVTLAMHRNPYGERPARNAARARVAMADVDPRHEEALGAAWIAGFAATVAPLGIDVLTLNHTHGASGPLSREGARVPAWSVQAALAQASGARVLEVHDLPDDIRGVGCLRQDGSAQLLLANTSGHTREVQLPDSTARELDAYETLLLRVRYG